MEINIAIKKAIEILQDSEAKLNPHSSYKIDEEWGFFYPQNNHPLDVRIIMLHSFKLKASAKSLEWLVFNPNFLIDKDHQSLFFELIARRVKNEPVSKIIGYKEFYEYQFLVNQNVLDPRPDSETLIELVIEYFKNKNNNNIGQKFLEMFTGSGCLAITILKQFTNFTAIASDISNDAINIAKQNSAINQVADRINFVNSDSFNNISGEFDFFIANPPYIPTSEIKNLQPEVKNYEPLISLDGGIDGLDFYRIIAKEATSFLKKDSPIFLEIGHNQFEDVNKIFINNDFILENFKQDLSGINRALCFKKLKHNIL
ncbi:MAG: peptide chain release factor N(5)-glutamine methyltransferase [Rickettsiales bacterium]|nr:peptide chain release factor N(5)-glutamine methyltransferase [Rickettsiales bacterium]